MHLLILALRELALASTIIAPSRNNIEQEVLLLLADEYRPACAFSMTNPGSLTMGFAGVDPRQLVPPSANQDSRTRTRSSPLEGFKITTSISIISSRSSSLQPSQVQHLDDCQIHRRQKRTRRPRRQTRGPYSGTPLEESRRTAEDSPISRRPTAARTPTTRQDND